LNWLGGESISMSKLERKVLIPTFRRPRFNYIGKIIGPGGRNLFKIMKKFKCRVHIRGKGSNRYPEDEQALLESGDPEHAHYAEPLHLKIDTNAPLFRVAYTRVANVLNVLAELFIPENFTSIPGITEPSPETNTNAPHGNAEDPGNEVKAELAVETPAYDIPFGKTPARRAGIMHSRKRQLGIEISEEETLSPGKKLALDIAKFSPLCGSVKGEAFLQDYDSLKLTHSTFVSGAVCGAA